MKQTKIILGTITILVLVHSCYKDRLDQPALGQLDEAKLANKRGVEALLIGAYALLDGVSSDNFGSTHIPFTNIPFWTSAASNWVYGSICGSEAYKGSDKGDQPEITAIERFEPDPTNQYFEGKWAIVYGGVQRANSVLRVMRKAKDILASDTPRIRAEALFLRAHYHFEAAKMWGKVPFVDESVTYEANNYRLPNKEFIWKAIENDFKYAAENLPDVQPAAIGRANKWAAKAYLAKTYLFQKEFANAKSLLTELIQNGVTSSGAKYKLLEHYADNFNPVTKNSEESVFAVQMSVNDGASNLLTGDPGNGNAGDILNFPYGAGPAGCCGFFQPSQYLVNHFKTNPITGLPYLETFNLSDVKNDDGLKQPTDTFSIDTQSLDPRLDWTVGRRGVPYLDWGLHPGQVEGPIGWVRFPEDGGPYTPIKNVYYKAQEGILNDAGYWTSGLTANNVNLIRFADILLWAAEAEVEAGTLDQARIYVNQVRERAANRDGWVKNNSGLFAPYAANYNIGLYPADTWTDQEKARKAVRFERMLELAMEGHRFFDLVRWEIAEKEINAYLSEEMTKRSHLAGAQFTKGTNEYFPIPQKQIDLSAGPDGIPKMKQNLGY